MHSERPGATYAPVVTYYVRSTALGGKVVAEIDQNGQFKKTKIYAGNALLATQFLNSFAWHHEDPITRSWSGSTSDGGLTDRDNIGPMGQTLGFSDPGDPLAHPMTYHDIKGAATSLYVEDGDPFNPMGGCSASGMAISCNLRDHMIDTG